MTSLVNKSRNIFDVIISVLLVLSHIKKAAKNIVRKMC